MAPHLVSEIQLAYQKKKEEDIIGNRPHTAHRTADADFMPLCSAFGGNNSRRRPHTPTSFCSGDKVAAMAGRRGSATQLAGCRLGHDCQSPSRGRINSSCSSWRSARPGGARRRQHADKRPLEWRRACVCLSECVFLGRRGLAVLD